MWKVSEILVGIAFLCAIMLSLAFLVGMGYGLYRLYTDFEVFRMFIHIDILLIVNSLGILYIIDIIHLNKHKG